MVVEEALTSYFEIEVRRTFIPKNFIAGDITYNTMAYIAVARADDSADGMDYA